METTIGNYKKVLNNFISFMDSEDDSVKEILCNDIDEMLDKILMEDGFGTEGQLDPRGDHRE